MDIPPCHSLRRFPPPWNAEETDACFIVRDGNGQALAYVYLEEEPGRRATAKLLTRDEARRIAANIASFRSCCKSGAEANEARSRRGAVLSVAALWLAVREADDATRL